MATAMKLFIACKRVVGGNARTVLVGITVLAYVEVSQAAPELKRSACPIATAAADGELVSFFIVLLAGTLDLVLSYI